MQLILPFPISVNSMYRAHRGRVIISKSGREYKAKIKAAINQLVKTGQLSAAANDSDLCVVVDLFPPTKQRRDIDNYTKSLFDAITDTQHIWLDDSQIKRQVMQMHESVGRNNARVELRIIDNKKIDIDIKKAGGKTG